MSIPAKGIPAKDIPKGKPAEAAKPKRTRKTDKPAEPAVDQE